MACTKYKVQRKLLHTMSCAFKVSLIGFKFLANPSKGLITFESLKKNSTLMGFDYLDDRELMAMVREGDKDSDGALNKQEFCAQGLLEEALIHKIQGVMKSSSGLCGSSFLYALLCLSVSAVFSLFVCCVFGKRE
ncbi:hypothetical protein AMTRI_Chr09g19690 [Amborella trichopoda]